MTIKEQVTSDMKDAMRARNKEKLSALRMLLAAVKQREVDERITATDDIMLGIIAKLVKQRRDSVEQFRAGGREDLARKESYEIEVLSAYLPKQMSEDEVKAVIAEVIAATGASGMASMGRVMGAVKAKVAGRADMGRVSGLVRAALMS